MGNIGYIKLFRSLRHCWVWNGEKFSRGQAWIDLLLSANHQDEKVPLGSQLFDVKRGSFITSKMKLADRWGWSNTKVDSFLKMLEQDGMITVKSDTKRTFVTIENWEFYQSVDNEKTKQKHNENETETEQEHNKDETETKQKHTVNNDKNVKECKRMLKKYIEGDSEESEKVNQAFEEFVDMRKKIKKPMTDRAVSMAISKLEKLSNGDADLAIKILNQSVYHNWQDLYALQNDSADLRKEQNDGAGTEQQFDTERYNELFAKAKAKGCTDEQARKITLQMLQM